MNFDSDAKNNAMFLFASGALIGGPVAEGQFQNIVEGGILLPVEQYGVSVCEPAILNICRMREYMAGLFPAYSAYATVLPFSAPPYLIV